MSTNGSTVFEEQSRHVLRNNARRCLRRTTLLRITSDVTWTPARANKVLGAGVQTSYVHSSILLLITIRFKTITITNQRRTYFTYLSVFSYNKCKESPEIVRLYVKSINVTAHNQFMHDELRSINDLVNTTYRREIKHNELISMT